MDNEKICRICLGNSHLLMYLFDGPGTVMLACKIANLTQVEVYHNDGLPDSICVNCNQKVDECIEFVNLCKKSDKYLRNKQKNVSVEKSNINPEENTEEDKSTSKYEVIDLRGRLTGENENKDQLKMTLQESCTELPEQRKLSNKHQCFTCGKIMSSRFRLKTHLATHLKDKPHSCIYCKKNFSIVENLNSHLRIHTGEKPYICLTCGEKFAHSSGLIVHKRKHTGQTPYQCTLCPRSFQTLGNFKYHIRMHTGERNYDCKTCSRSFITSSDLKQHKATHTGEKPHICSICGIRFSRASNLKRHLSYLHKEEKSFICQHCPLSFFQKIDLTKHEKCHKINII